MAAARFLAPALSSALGGAGLGLYAGIGAGGGAAWPACGALLALVLALAEARGRDPRTVALAWMPGALLLLEPWISPRLQMPSQLSGMQSPEVLDLMVRRYVGGALLVLAVALGAGIRAYARPGGFPAIRRPGRWVAWLTAGAAALFAVLACLAFRSFHKYVDCAVENEVVWRLSRGEGPLTLLHESFQVPQHPVYWSYHFTLIWALVAPLYRLWSSPQLLLILQAAAVCAAAIPIYLASRTRLGERQAAGLAAAYLLYPTTQHAMLHEIHGLSWAVPFTAGLWWALGARRWAWAALFGLMAMTCREEAALALAGVGLALLFEPRRRLAGLILLAASAALFVWLLQGVMPGLSGGATTDWRSYKFSDLGSSNREIAATLLTRPLFVLRHFLTADKLANAALFLLPLAGLPLLGGRVALAALPLFLAIFLSNNAAAYCYLLFYTLPVSPFLFMGAGEALMRLQGWGGRRLRDAAWAALLGASLAASALFGPSPLGATFWKRDYVLGAYAEPYHHRSVYAQTGHARLGRDLLARIPDDAVVSAQAFFQPHLARVKRMQMLPRIEGSGYVLLDASHPNRYDLWGAGRYEAFVRSLREDPVWECLADEDGYLLFRRRRP